MAHLNGDTPGWNSRDPYFVLAGTECNGTILWSQPEVALYIIPPCADKRCGIGYPDFVEEGSSTADGAEGSSTSGWRIYLTETDKVRSRVHALDMEVLQRMWAQTTASAVAKGAVASWARGSPQSWSIPSLGNLSAGASFTIELAFDGGAIRRAALGTESKALLDCRDAQGHGVAVLVGEVDGHAVLNLTLCDEHARCQAWHTDAEASFEAKGTHAHAVLIVDGRARLIMTVANGKWADGGSHRAKGYTHIGGGLAGDGGIGVVDGATSCGVDTGAVRALRLYDRPLLVSESIANWRHAQSPPS